MFFWSIVTLLLLCHSGLGKNLVFSSKTQTFNSETFTSNDLWNGQNGLIYWRFKRYLLIYSSTVYSRDVEDNEEITNLL